jgi:hypothetical protein
MVGNPFMFYPAQALDQLASEHRNSALLLREVACRDVVIIPTKQTGANAWGRGQFLRGMVDEIREAKMWQDPEGEWHEPKLAAPDYALIAALTNLIFDTDYIAKDVRQAMNTSRSSRSRKAVK